MRIRPSDLLFLLLTTTVVAAAAGSCGGSNQVLGNTGSGAGSTGSSMGGAQSNGTMSTASMSNGSMSTATMSTGTMSTGTGGGVSTIYPCTGCPTFPPSGTPTCPPATLGAPTIAYPLDGLLLPPNMNVLEVQFVPPAGATLFEVDFTNAITNVKVETMCNAITPVRGGPSSGCGVTLPQAAWNDIANTNRDGDPVQVTVRATTGTGACVTSSTAKIAINFAKDDIIGGIYYWQSATYGGVGGKTGGIYSHDFGSFDPTPTPFYTSGASGTCVGCHFLSRDGARISLTFDDPDGDDEFGDERSGVLDVASRTGLAGMTQLSPGFQTFTHDHGKMITSTFKPAMTMPMLMSNQGFGLYDSSGTTLTVLKALALPTGMLGTQPDLSSDDSLLAFVVPQAGTIDKSGDHHFLGGSIYTAAFHTSTNTLDTFTPLLAATGNLNNYYPNIAPDGSFVIYNEATPSMPLPTSDAGTVSNGDAFYARNARVKLLHLPAPAGGGSATPIDLAALNVANGLSNSWPRWSPYVQTYKGHRLLWVTFSSNRDYGLHLSNQGFDNCYPPEGPMYDQPQPLSKAGVTYQSCAEPQIWMAGIIVDPDPSLDSGDRSFPAFWLPFQDVTSHNHSAQWVQKIQGPGTPDGGTGSSTSTSTGTGSSSSGGSKCGEFGATCGFGSALCCSDVLCCNGTCQYTCAQ
jgi:hypothetical protein